DLSLAGGEPHLPRPDPRREPGEVDRDRPARRVGGARVPRVFRERGARRALGGQGPPPAGARPGPRGVPGALAEGPCRPLLRREERAAGGGGGDAPGAGPALPGEGGGGKAGDRARDPVT